MRLGRSALPAFFICVICLRNVEKLVKPYPSINEVGSFSPLQLRIANRKTAEIRLF